MVKLFIKIFVFVCLVLSISISTLYLNPGYDFDYLSSIKLKLEKLKSISSKKIVIIGGSNVNFGVDSEQIENTVKIPVINLGLHASLGPEFWVNYVKDELSNGDILIMSPEYVTLNKDIWYGMSGTRVPKTILYTPSKIKILLTNYQLFKKTVVGVFRTIKYTWRKYPFKPLPITHGVYDIRAFKEDNINGKYLNRSFNKKVNKVDIVFDREKINIDRLMFFDNYFKKNKIAFYISPPSIIDEKYGKYKAKSFFDSIGKVTGIKILNKNSDYLFKRKYFNDTEYHLNKDGRELRSALLAKDINEIILKKLIEKDLSYKQKTIGKINKSTIKLGDLNNIYNADYILTENALNILPKDLKKPLFARYKTKKNLSNNLITFFVKGKKHIIDKLHFRSIGIHNFDYVNNIKDDLYSFCIDLSEITVKAKDGFYYYGIGLRSNTLNPEDKFNIIGVNYNENNISCETVFNYDGKSYSFDSKNQIFLFSVLKRNTTEDIKLNKILNINSNVVLKESIKYLVKVDKSTFIIKEFYSDKVIFLAEINTTLKFIKSDNYLINLIK